MSLPIINFFSFPIVVLWKRKYNSCNKVNENTSSENSQESTKTEEL